MKHEELYEIIHASCEKVAIDLEKHFPNLRTTFYAKDSASSINGSDFVNRLAFGVQMELIRSGLFFDITTEEYKL